MKFTNLHENKEMFKLTDIMEFHFIEMSKLMRDWKADKLDPWNDVLARWLLMLGIVDHRNKKVYKDIYKELEAVARGLLAKGMDIASIAEVTGLEKERIMELNI